LPSPSDYQIGNAEKLFIRPRLIKNFGKLFNLLYKVGGKEALLCGREEFRFSDQILFYLNPQIIV